MHYKRRATTTLSMIFSVTHYVELHNAISIFTVSVILMLMFCNSVHTTDLTFDGVI